MTKIIVFGANLKDDQKARLEALGEVKYFPSPSSSDELVKQAKGADVLYSDGAFLLDSLSKLKNVFVTYPYVELGVFNSEELKKNGVMVANSQGGNRSSIIEWVMFMTLSLFRKFTPMVRATKNFPVELQETLSGKKVLIVGKGSIGTKIAVLCEAFGMKVGFFERGDNLLTKSADVDLVINALNCNSTSKNLLDEKFFMSLKKGTYFVSFVRQYTYSLDGLLKSINSGIVGGAAIDCDPEKFGDTTNEFYQKALSNPKVLVTPHIAFSTKQAIANGAEIAVQNIEALIAGKPQNVLTKR
ncbi:MAG: NAD(P)-dependent oxidoreductase [Candidatus Beckwithbacteria bacterium]